MRGFYLGTLLQEKFIESNKTYGIVEEAYNAEFDETSGSQNKYKNLDDVRSILLGNAIKNMVIGDIMSRVVIQVKEDQAIPPSSMQTNDQHSTNGSHEHDQDQSQQVQDK